METMEYTKLELVGFNGTSNTGGGERKGGRDGGREGQSEGGMEGGRDKQHRPILCTIV